jgi:hypothetical protein
MSFTLADWLSIPFLGIVVFAVAVFFGSPAPEAIALGIAGAVGGFIRAYHTHRKDRR